MAMRVCLFKYRDYADDPNRINKIKEGRIKEGASEETGFSQRTYKNEKGWYIDEMEKYRGVGNEKTIIESDISITTPRFYVALQAFPKMGESAPGASSLITLIDKSQLPRLFKLPVTQGEGDIENPGDDDAYTTISKDPYLSMAIKIIS
ncbi:hypothetical protein OOZ15_03175 [Galbibacter sp. EGI 63066]|uniref:hypothetical protein n=1 Tax=Galbibacter sp. EGI 63066 TaxID=2993559 RepID=UPI002249348A|nr:hypothetical protein [Galbibacter sp. EGI 63066]MCX2678932.1 hypothetical protein [Galbibacter sp. EGI 63066]